MYEVTSPYCACVYGISEAELKYYPVDLPITPIAILFGVVAMYINKKQGFSVKELDKKQ